MIVPLACKNNYNNALLDTLFRATSGEEMPLEGRKLALCGASSMVILRWRSEALEALSWVLRAAMVPTSKSAADKSDTSPSEEFKGDMFPSDGLVCFLFLFLSWKVLGN